MLTDPFKPLELIESSQIVQERVGLVRVRLVRKAVFTGVMEEILRKEFSAHLGSHVEIQIEYVDRIDRTEAGKYRWVISHVSHDPSGEFD